MLAEGATSKANDFQWAGDSQMVEDLTVPVAMIQRAVLVAANLTGRVIGVTSMKSPNLRPLRVTGSREEGGRVKAGQLVAPN